MAQFRRLSVALEGSTSCHHALPKGHHLQSMGRFTCHLDGKISTTSRQGAISGIYENFMRLLPAWQAQSVAGFVGTWASSLGRSAIALVANPGERLLEYVNFKRLSIHRSPQIAEAQSSHRRGAFILSPGVYTWRDSLHPRYPAARAGNSSPSKRGSPRSGLALLFDEPDLSVYLNESPRNSPAPQRHNK